MSSTDVETIRAALETGLEVAGFYEGDPFAALDALVSERERLQRKLELRGEKVRLAEAEVERLQQERDKQISLGDALRVANANLRDANGALAAQLAEAQQALEDISDGDWQRYPERERHGQTTVEAYAEWVLEQIAALAVSPGGGTVERTQE